MAASMPSHLRYCQFDGASERDREQRTYMLAEMIGNIQALSHHRSKVDHCIAKESGGE